MNEMFAEQVIEGQYESEASQSKLACSNGETPVSHLPKEICLVSGKTGTE